MDGASDVSGSDYDPFAEPVDEKKKKDEAKRRKKDNRRALYAAVAQRPAQSVQCAPFGKGLSV